MLAWAEEPPVNRWGSGDVAPHR